MATATPAKVQALRDKFNGHLAGAQDIGWRRCLFYGPSRSGKTTLLGSCAFDTRTTPHLVLDFGGGTGSLYGISPEKLQVCTINDWDDFNNIYEFLASGESGFKSVSVDSLTDTHLYALIDVVDNALEVNSKRKDENTVQQDDFGKALFQMRRFLIAMRQLPMHVFFTALAKTEAEPREGLVRKPFLFGQLSEEVVGMFDVTAFLASTKVSGKGTDEDPVSERVLVLQNYPGLRVGIRTPFGKTIPDRLKIGPADGVTKLFDILEIKEAPSKK